VDVAREQQRGVRQRRGDAERDAVERDVRTPAGHPARPSHLDVDAALTGRPDAVLRLQRVAGNRVTAAMLEAAEQADLQAAHDVETEALPVGAADDHAEHDADRLADLALRRLAQASPARDVPAPDGNAALHRSAPTATPLAGAFDAPPQVADRVRARAGRGGSSLPDGVRRSMEQGFGTSFSAVRIHSDAEAGRLAASLGAEAFTHGRDIFFGNDRYRPDAPDGQLLLAHELAHVVQGRGSVQRKLVGTSAAVEQMGGQAAGRNKVKKFFGAGDGYTKIMEALRAYEKREAEVVAKQAFGKSDQKWMLAKLNDISNRIDKWLASNDELAAGTTARKKRTKQVGQAGVELHGASADEAAELQRTIEGSELEKRVSALKMLRPRLTAEQQDVASPGYFKVKSFNDQRLATGGTWNEHDAVGGAANRLDKVEYSGGEKGFFIPEKRNVVDQPQDASYSGIDRLDPNQGARSVASARLAKLFGANVLADIEFATHASATGEARMGVMSAQAKGSEARSVKVARNPQERAELEKNNDPSTIDDVDDPELQRSLNILQRQDYISRQLDRHTHNYYIATDAQGKVVGVTGIDLDVSFGAAKNQGGNLEAYDKFLGIPELADAAFRAKVLSVKPEEIRACLDGLLEKPEVDATIERFTHLSTVLQNMDPTKIVPMGGWGKETAAAQSRELTEGETEQGIGKHAHSYLVRMQQDTLDDEFRDKAFDVLAPLDSMQTEKKQVNKAVHELVRRGSLSPGAGLGLLEALVEGILTDPSLVEKRDKAAKTKKEDADVGADVAKLAEARAALQKTGGTPDLLFEADEMIAEIHKELTAEAAKLAGQDYEKAVATLIQRMCEFAVKFNSRQKRQMSPTRPRRGAKVGARS
jgi:hypothetical protein